MALSKLALEVQLRGALAPGLTFAQREAIVSGVREVLGLKLYRWSHFMPAWITRFSMSLGFGIVFSRKKARASAEERLCTVTHEVTHAVRAHLLGAWMWRARYFLSPSFRQAEELEADAHGLAMRAQIWGAPLSSPLIQRSINANARQWTEWRAPYFCGGTLERLRSELEARVIHIIASAD